MNLVNHTISSLWGGVSNQPDNVRIENQCEEAINCSLSVVEGVGKRTPTNFLLKNNLISDTSKLYLIEKENEKYALIFNIDLNEPISVYDLNTLEKKTVTYGENSKEYLLNNLTNPKQDLSVLNLSDNTIISNKHVECKMVDTYNKYVGVKKSAFGEIVVDLTEIVEGDNIKLDVNTSGLDLFNAFNYVIQSGDTYATIKTAIESQMDTNFSSQDRNWTHDNTEISESAGVVGCPEFVPDVHFFKYNDSRYNWAIQRNECGIAGVFAYQGDGEVLPGSGLKALFVTEPNITPCGDGTDTYNSIDEFINKAVFVNEDNYDYYNGFFGYESTWDCSTSTEPTPPKLIIKTFIVNSEYDYEYIAQSVNALSNFGDKGIELNQSEGIINITKGVIKTTYTAIVQGDIIATVDSEVINSTKTVDIANALLSELNSYSKFSENYLGTVYGNSIWIKNKINRDFTLSTTDSYGDSAMNSFNRRANSQTDLPFRTKEGFTININANATEEGGYWLKYNAGEWVETIKPFTNYKIDNSTMPITLKEDGGEFILETILYNEKLVGDDITTPNPLFINNKISELFFYKNRLGFISNENLIFSRSDDYFNYFYKTASNVLADDYISIAASDSSLPIIGIKPFNSQLISFTEKAQYNISSEGQPFSPGSVSATRVITSDSSKNCNLISAGSNLYSTAKNGDFTSVNEYFVQPDTLINDHATVTAHCPKYLPKDIEKITYESNNDILFFKTNVSNEIYVYNYKWSGNQKVQSAWSKFIFDFDVIDFDIIGSDIYLIIERNNQRELIKASFSNNYETFNIFLDRKVETNQTIVDGYVNITIPDYNFEELNLDKYSVIDSRGFLVETDIIYVDSNTIKFLETNDITNTYTVGLNYSMDMKFNTLNYKSNGTNIGETAGRLTIRKVRLSYTDSLSFQLYTDINDNIKTKNFNSSVLDNLTLDSLITKSGNFDMNILKKNDKFKLGLRNDSHLPSYLTSMSWIGILSKRTHTI